MKNTFKNNTEPKKLNQERTPRKLNPPQFEYAPISMERKGIFWLGAIIATEFRRF